MHRGTEKKNLSSPLHRWHEEIMRHLISILETSITRDKPKDIAQIVEIIFNNQTRSPWPGSFLSKEKKEVWRQYVAKNANILNYSDGPAALSEFASKITNRLLRELSATQISSTLLSHEAERNTQIEHMIRQEFYLRNSSEDTVSRSVQRYFRENARTKRNQTEIKSSENDPLRDLLGLPRIGRSVLPHEDIRVHMIKFLTASSKLSTILSFETSSLEGKLGKEFAGKCKPVGFADKQRKFLIVDVASPLAAQELAFSKSLFISRIKKISGFESVTDIKFRIAPKKIEKD